MMRITRDDEQWIGRARPALHSRIKIGFRKDGRILALDGLAIVDNGPYDVVGDGRSAGRSHLAVVSADGDALAQPVGADQHAAARGAAGAGRLCRATR